MQAGGVTVLDAYDISGRVLVDGRDIGADVETVSVGRDIPSGLPDGGGFTSASGTVTAAWGDDVSDRVEHPWSPNPVWPPEPNSTVEVVLSDGSGREWTQFKGVIVDPSGSLSTRSISFGIRDNYRSLDRLVTVPALANRMPALVDANVYRYIGLQSAFLTDLLLRAGGRYCTPPPQPGFVVSATMMGSTWPERGTITESVKDVPDGGTVSYPNWVVTDYGLAVQNVHAVYEPNLWSGVPGGGRITHHPFELTQEVMPAGSGVSTQLRARFEDNRGMVGFTQASSFVYVTYTSPGGNQTTLLTVPKSGMRRVTARFSMSGSTLTAELRSLNRDGQVVRHGTATHNVGTGLNGPLRHVWARGEGAQGAFQAVFPTRSFGALDFQPNAVMHIARAGRNTLTGVPPQIDTNVLDLLNEQADAEFAQWWIDEHDVLQWWDRGLLAQQPIVGTLTGQDHVQDLSWSHDYDAARHRVHVKYQEPEVDQRWRTNLTLWEGNGETLEEGDMSEIFVNVPNDEIWLGVDLNPARYSQVPSNYWAINRGIKSVYGGIAINDDGEERRTNSIIPSVRKVTDDTFVFEHDITALGSSEQAALELPSERATDSSLWARHFGKGLPILRGKMRILFQDATSTSDITGNTNAPDYTHDHGWWIQETGYAGRTADYAAASLTQPRPKIEGLDIMPVLALQVGDHIRVTIPDVAELELTGVVTSNNLDANLAAGTIHQSISIMPTNIESLARRWADFGHVFGGRQWQSWAQSTSNDTWTEFGNHPLD